MLILFSLATNFNTFLNKKKASLKRLFILFFIVFQNLGINIHPRSKGNHRRLGNLPRSLQ